MFITIITDCIDQNAKGRQLTRFSSLFNITPTFIDIRSDLEAAGNIIDVLDSNIDAKGIIIANIAPRHNVRTKWTNGSPFGYFQYKNTLIISTIDGYTLSLVKKFNLTQSIKILDLETVLQEAKNQNLIKRDEQDYIKNTQFRSFEFVPRVAYWLENSMKLPSKSYSISNIPQIPKTIWFIDNFGNCKTTLLQSELSDKHQNYKIRSRDCKFYKFLKDVPDNKSAIITGSSGLGRKRFLEIVIQGKNASKELELNVGSKLHCSAGRGI